MSTTMKPQPGQARQRAACPGAPEVDGLACGKVCQLDHHGRFPNHRRPTGGNCFGSLRRARTRDLVHPCVDCAALPLRPADLSTITDADNAYVGPFRPSAPRPVAGKRRCASHLREHERALREARSDRRRETRYGITKPEFAELLAAQGGGCACGKVHGATRRNGSPIRLPATDHDHERQAKCVAAGLHDVDTCCKRCVRGALGLRCNREIVGRFTPDQLRRLADYMEAPTAQRLGWWDEPLQGDEGSR